jgi:hypothetical protein
VTNRPLIAVPAIAWALVAASSQPYPRRGAASSTPSASVSIQQAFERRPLAFEANRGQFAEDVRFGARARGSTVLLTDLDAVLLPLAVSGRTTQPIRLRVDDGDATSDLIGERPLEGRVNYFIGRDPATWVTAVSTYGSVRRPNVYPGIDVVYHSRGQDLEYDFVVHPGGNPTQIRLRLEGGNRVELDDFGDLVLRTADGVFRHKAPELYQDADGRRTVVGGRYVIQDDGLVTFDVEPYDRSRPLVIDPVVEHSTYFAGINGSSIRDLAVDSSGNTYIVGAASSTGEFPVTSVNEMPPLGGPWDAFVAKIAADGQTVMFLTFLGGLPEPIWPGFGGYETGLGVGVHTDGSVFVCGSTTSKDFPVVNAFQPLSNDESAGDGFVAKLSAEGESLLFSTFLGGSNADESSALAVSADGDVYVVGKAASPNFPVLNALLPTKPNAAPTRDAVITRLSSAGMAIFSTYWGGTGGETTAKGVALSAAGDLIVAGSTGATAFPTLNGYDSTPNGPDGFVTRFSNDGATVQYSTVLGGSSTDELTDVALGPNDHIFVTGWTISSDFPVANAFQTNNAGGFDWFVTKLDLSGAGLAYSTYIGGTGNDHSTPSIAVDSLDQAVVAGASASTDFPLVNAIQTARYPTAGTATPALIKLNASGTTLVYSTYIGGPVFGQLRAVALDTAGRAHLAGTVGMAAPLIITPNALQWSPPGGEEAGFLAVIADDSETCTYLTSPRVRTIGITGGSGSFSAGALGSGCDWSASSDVPWIILTGSTSGTGVGTVPYVVQANFGFARMGTVTLNGAVFTIQQVGTSQVGCDWLDWDVPDGFQPEGGAGEIPVSADFGPCTWHAASDSDWITMAGPTSFSGSGVVSFSLAPNPSVAPRFGTIYVAGWPTEIMQRGRNLILYGQFNPMAAWKFFATPDTSYLQIVSNSNLQFYRVPPPPGTNNQAVVFQETGAPMATGEALHASFDLANSSTVRKRISVLIHDSNFQDLTVCTFWLEAAAPLRTYHMRTHATQPWTNATLSFYAASAGSNGGYYVLDNVVMMRDAGGSAHETFCEDPTTPAPAGGGPGPELLSNGDFSANLASWGLFGQIVQQISAGVFEFFRPPGTPSGVILQGSGDQVGVGQFLTARFDLGNSSGVRKRVTVLLHETNFSDLSACTFWLAPGTPLATYEMGAVTTRPWTNATISVYPSTVGTEQWIRLDNVSLKNTPSAAAVGTTCVEPQVDGTTLMAGSGKARLVGRRR